MPQINRIRVNNVNIISAHSIMMIFMRFHAGILFMTLQTAAVKVC